MDELTPPTLFTVGASAEPPKSLANCNLPFTNAVASGVIEPVTCAATKAVVAICVELVPGAAVTAVGVPVSAGLVDNTNDPVPVEVFVPVPPLVIANGVVNVNVPDDIAVAVIVPASKLPLPSLLTIVFAVLDEVAESTFDATVVIVDELTPPTVLIVAAAVTSAVPLNVGLVYVTSPALTGTPTAVTAAPGTNSTQIATTAFVAAQVTGSITPDATALVKGKLQLTNDLSGTAELPTVN
ncbi:MAG: hypothetical protein ACK4X2_09250, partial [Bacteroidota bacterium]